MKKKGADAADADAAAVASEQEEEERGRGTPLNISLAHGRQVKIVLLPTRFLFGDAGDAIPSCDYSEHLCPISASGNSNNEKREWENVSI